MKKQIQSLAFCFALFTASFAPVTSHAALGAVFSLIGAGAGLPLLIAGTVAIGASRVTLQISRGHCVQGFGCELSDAGMVGLFVMLPAGIILLDASQGADSNLQPFAFGSVDAEQAASIGMTENERIAYNGEVQEVNAVYETIVSDLHSLSQKGLVIDSEVAHSEWLKHQSDFSEEAFAALQKVSGAVSKAFATAKK